MTFFLEISRPCQRKPWWFASESMYRCGWMWFAVGLLRVPFRDLCERPWNWKEV